MTIDVGLLFALFIASFGLWQFVSAVWGISRHFYADSKRMEVLKIRMVLWRLGLHETMEIRSARYYKWK